MVISISEFPERVAVQSLVHIEYWEEKIRRDYRQPDTAHANLEMARKLPRDWITSTYDQQC